MPIYKSADKDQPHPIIQLLNKCASDNNLKPKHLTAAIICDISKAFGIINHNILIRKLDHYGIRGIAKNLDGKLSDKQKTIR